MWIASARFATGAGVAYQSAACSEGQTELARLVAASTELRPPVEAAAATPTGGGKLLHEHQDGARDSGPAEHEEHDRERKVVPGHSDFPIGRAVGTP